MRRLYRWVVPAGVRERVNRAREGSKVLLNYFLMRLGLAGAWPHALYIESTNICNAACVFCAYPQMERPKVTMPLDTFKKAVEQYLEIGPGEIDLTPIVGDPFVDKLLFERLDFLSAHPKVRKFHFYTNAILMKPEYIEKIVTYDERFRVFCSFGGFDAETYHKVMGVPQFGAAVAHIKALVEAKRRSGSKIQVSVNLRIPPGNNKGEFWEFLKANRDAGLLTFTEIDTFDNWGGAIKDEDLRGAGLVPKAAPVHHGPCRRLVTGPIVLADGRVNACTCRDVEATLIIGNVNEKPLGEILRGKPLQDLLASHERKEFPDACKLCSRYESVYDLGHIFRRSLDVE